MRGAIVRSLPVLAALSLPGAGGCSPAVSEAPGKVAQAGTTHPESGLAIVPLGVRTDGKTHRFRVELARGRLEQARGLMFRAAMGADEGMLFPLDPPRVASFWMKNTVIPLDIIFIGRDRRILNVAANTVPYSEDQILSEGEAVAVLELIGGRAAQLGIGPGDEVTW